MEKENAIIINGIRYDLVEIKGSTCDDCALTALCEETNSVPCLPFKKSVDTGRIFIKTNKLCTEK